MASTSTAIDEGTVFGLAVAAMWQCPRFCFHSDCFADEMWNNGSPEDLRWPTTICDRISTRITIYTCSLHRRRIRFTTYYFQPNAISYGLFDNSSNERATVIVHGPNNTSPTPQLDETNIFWSPNMPFQQTRMSKVRLLVCATSAEPWANYKMA